jgi:carbon-monoxide dehydrogenase medium subunit
MGAEIVLRSAAGDRSVPAREFFLGFMDTTKRPNELVAEIVVPAQGSQVGVAFVKFARVEGSFAIVNSVARVDVAAGEAAVGLGGVGSRPLVIDVPMQANEGLTQEVLQEAGQRAYDGSEGATGDVFADSEYRREMARVFTARALVAAAKG